MRFFSVLFAVLLATACGDDVRRYTWGDAASAVVSSFCSKAEECGFNSYAQCYKHSYHHLCELPDTCDKATSPGAEEAVDACAEAVDAMEVPDSCGAIYWGILPGECREVFKYDPARQ